MSRLFISHASVDRRAATEAAKRFEAWGYQFLFLAFDPKLGVTAGSRWENELYRQLRLSDALIALLSDSFAASQWCFAELTHARAMGKPIFPVLIEPCPLHVLVADRQIIDLTRNDEEGWQQLRRGLEAAGLAEELPFEPNRPYPGLSAFDANDAGVFHGRDEERKRLLEALERMRRQSGPRLYLVLGASGSGKSSLVRAGVLPRLAKDPRWLVIPPWRPSELQAWDLAHAFKRALGPPSSGQEASAITGTLEPDSAPHRWTALANDLRNAKGRPDAAVLLVIDQLEELLSQGAGSEAADAAARLRSELHAALTSLGTPLFAIATLRSDFLGSFQDALEFRGLDPEDMLLEPMPKERLKEVITLPAKRVALELGEGLVDRLVEDTGSGSALPLLAFTLHRLWERKRRGEALTVDLYEREIGSIDRAVAAIVEGIVPSDLDAATGTALRSAFLFMVRLDDEGRFVRQHVAWDQLADQARPLLERFVKERLLVSRTVGEKGQRQVEVAHEALFRAWGPLARWLEEARELLRFRQRLRHPLAEWDRLKRKAPDALLRGEFLAEAERWRKEAPDGLTADQRTFIEESLARRGRLRLLKIASVSVVLLLVVSIAVPWKWANDNRLPVAYIPKYWMWHLPIPGPIPPVAQSLPLGVTCAMGKYEVTFEEYDYFVFKSNSAAYPIDSFDSERARYPVINVSWDDARAYVKWLRDTTGEPWRLPKNREWQTYAESERAVDFVGRANCANCRTDMQSKGTAPVGRYANAWDLFDMAGNVAEWVERDEDGPRGSPGTQLVRGGAWLHNKDRIGADASEPIGRHVRDERWIGFRVCRDTSAPLQKAR